MANTDNNKTDKKHAAEAARQLRKFAGACRLDGHPDECDRIDAAAYLLDPTADVEEMDDVESAGEIAADEPPPTKPKRGSKSAWRATASEQVIEYEDDLDDLPVEPAQAKIGKKKPARE